MIGVTPILNAVAPASTMDRGDGPHEGNPAVRASRSERRGPAHGLGVRTPRRWTWIRLYRAGITTKPGAMTTSASSCLTRSSGPPKSTSPPMAFRAISPRKTSRRTWIQRANRTVNATPWLAGRIHSRVAWHYLVIGAARQITTPSLRNPSSISRTTVADGLGVIRSDVSVCPATKYPTQLVVTPDEADLPPDCCARTPIIQIEPRTRSKTVNPITLQKVAFISSI